MRKTVIAILALVLMLAATGVYAQTDTEQAFITINLDAGFVLDPLIVSVNGGGSLDATTLGPNCVGYINPVPTVQVNWTGEADFLRAFFYSDHDSVLVVQSPDGNYLCNDDVSPMLLDASLELTEPETGLYSVWVGSFAPEQLIPGFLVFTDNPQITAASFNIDTLVQREFTPEMAEEPVMLPVDTLQLDASANALNMTLASGDEPLVEAITTAGDVPLFDIDHENSACTGYIDDVPTLAFSWSGMTDNLRVYFESDHDTTLLVVTPEGSFLCNDDTAGINNLNPSIHIPTPSEGEYLVFVGRFDPQYEITGTLTVTESQDTQPAALSVTLPEAIEPATPEADSE